MAKNYQKLWTELLRDLAQSEIPRPAIIPKSAFKNVVEFIRMEAEIEGETKLVEAFRDAKLNLDDPFHWWELLHGMILIHTNRPAGNSRKWTEEKLKKLERDCVKVGRKEPPTKTIRTICTRLKEREGYTETEEHLAFQITRYRLTERIKRKIAR